MATSVIDTCRTTMMGAINSSIGTSSHLKIYAGTAPAKTAAPLSAGATLLSTMVCANPFGTAASMALTAGAISPDTAAAAAGTPTWWRVIDGAVDDGAHSQLQGTCTVSLGGTDGVNLVFTSLIAANGNVAVTSFTLVEGNP
jgi:hypothetical protein